MAQAPDAWDYSSMSNSALAKLLSSCYAVLCRAVPCRALLLPQVRDAFRRYMAQAPDAWDYSSSDIPSPLTDELEAAQLSKKVSRQPMLVA
jgi:hypothetical protein